MNSGVFPWENKHDSHWTFVPECPCEKFMNWPFFGLVCQGHFWFSLPFFQQKKNKEGEGGDAGDAKQCPAALHSAIPKDCEQPSLWKAPNSPELNLPQEEPRKRSSLQVTRFPVGRHTGNLLPALLLSLVAFHPRPQIASDLGRNPHRNRNQFPSGNESLAYGRRFKSQPASTRCHLRIASPTRPFLQVIWTPQIADPQAAIAELGPPGGRKSQNRWPQGH